MAKRGRKPDKKKPGPKTKLTESLLKSIRHLIIEGKSLKEIAEVCKVPEKTFYTWHSDNYLSLADKIEQWKRDRKLFLAENNIEDVLEMDIEEPIVTMIGLLKDSEGNIIKKKNTSLTKIKADMSQFVVETLGKSNYSKRQEITGKDGEQLGVIVLPQKNADTLEADNQTTGSSSQDRV